LEKAPDGSHLIVDSDCLNGFLSSKESWVRDNFNSTLRSEVATGYVGKLLGKHIITDSFRYDTLRVLDIREMILIGPHAKTGQLVYEDEPQVHLFLDPQDQKQKLHFQREVWLHDTIKEAGCTRFVLR